MAKRRVGYVFFDRKYKRHRGRISFTDDTGKRREKWVSGDSASECYEKLDAINADLKAGKMPRSKKVPKTFADLANEFLKSEVNPAVFVNGQKVAGYKCPETPKIHIATLVAHFGKIALNAIRPKDVQAFKLERLATPTYLDKAKGRKKSTRKIASVNRELSMLRAVFSYGKENGFVESSPFDKRSSRRRRGMIDVSLETRRERVPSFGEELAILEQCTKRRAHLRDILILGADTGMRRGELLSLTWPDIDLQSRQIKLRPENTKTGRARSIPMTERVFELLTARHGYYESAKQERARWGIPLNNSHEFVFGGITSVDSSFGTACRWAGIEDLTLHDYCRHAYITRSMLAGIPPAVVLKASGHASDEWKRYLNVTPDVMRNIWQPHNGQSVAEVKAYGEKILKQLAESLGFLWKDGQARFMVESFG